MRRRSISSYLRAGAEGVEHVEEDEAGEGHRRVSRSDHVVLQLKHKNTSENHVHSQLSLFIDFGNLKTTVLK